MSKLITFSMPTSLDKAWNVICEAFHSLCMIHNESQPDMLRLHKIKKKKGIPFLQLCQSSNTLNLAKNAPF